MVVPVDWISHIHLHCVVSWQIYIIRTLHPRLLYYNPNYRSTTTTEVQHSIPKLWPVQYVLLKLQYSFRYRSQRPLQFNHPIPRRYGYLQLDSRRCWRSFTGGPLSSWVASPFFLLVGRCGCFLPRLLRIRFGRMDPMRCRRQRHRAWFLRRLLIFYSRTNKHT